MNSFIRNLSTFIFALTAIILAISHVSNAERLKRYTGGRSARPGECNWVVSIGYKDDPYHHLCGGSIIDEDYILTAAHCTELILPSELIIRSGGVDLRDTIITGVSRIIKHPNYKLEAGKSHPGPNDIAILKLTESLLLGNSMKAIQLPKKDRKTVPAAIFASWGAISEQPNEVFSPMLQIGKMDVISDKKCEKMGRPARRPQYICAYDLTGAALEGDSGSPLTYGDEIIGILESGLGEIGVPMAFTNVYYYVDWIEETIDITNWI